MELARLFGKVIESRRQDPERNARESDLLSSFIQAQYSPSINNGRMLTSDEIGGMLIATLFAGQHTSSITSTWTLLFLLRHQVRRLGRMLTMLAPDHASLMATMQHLSHTCSYGICPALASAQVSGHALLTDG